MNELIRNQDCVSCTITDVDSMGNAVVEFAHFKEARFDVSCIVIYEFSGEYYYPMALEYRLIDNNILYLTEELGVKTIKEVFDILSSSMEKEEKWTNHFKLILVHLKNKPLYCHKMDGFMIDNVDMVEIYE